MHKSKLAGFIIDCNAPDLQGAARFWGNALGMELKPLPGEEGKKYMRLEDPTGRVELEVQTVTHASRVHLDIEADDVEAEVQRLEALGAKRVEKVHSWWVMEAPTGQRFCVVNPQRGPLEGKANVWGDAAPAPAPVKSNACPKCRPEPMKEETFEGIAIDRCPVCKGIFLDRGELEALLERRLGPRVDAFAFTATSDAMDAVRGTCPRCQKQMEASVGPEGLRVDQCSACGGVFLEQGELATLQLAKA